MLPGPGCPTWVCDVSRSVCQSLVRKQLSSDPGIADAGCAGSVPAAELRGLHSRVCAAKLGRAPRGRLRRGNPNWNYRLDYDDWPEYAIEVIQKEDGYCHIAMTPPGMNLPAYSLFENGVPLGPDGALHARYSQIRQWTVFALGTGRLFFRFRQFGRAIQWAELCAEAKRDLTEVCSPCANRCDLFCLDLDIAADSPAITAVISTY